MSGIYQKQTNSGSVASPSAGRTLISVNESGELFTKDSTGNISITQPKFVTVETAHLVNVESLFGAITADPFDVEDWKASFTVSIPDGSILTGVYETAGDFSTEVSYGGIIGLTPSDDETYKEVIMASANFRPAGGTILGGIEESSTIKVGGFDNIEVTYKYEEDPTATGANPKYLHDFRLTVDSTQILGYVVINANDSISANNFITDSAGG